MIHLKNYYTKKYTNKLQDIKASKVDVYNEIKDLIQEDDFLQVLLEKKLLTEKELIDNAYMLRVYLDTKKICGKCKTIKKCPFAAAGVYIEANFVDNKLNFFSQLCAKGTKKYNVEQKLIKYLKISHITKLPEISTFYEIVPTGNVQKSLIEILKNFYLVQKDQTKGIFLSVSAKKEVPTRGKTYLMQILMLEKILRGVDSAFIDCQKLSDDFRKSWQDKTSTFKQDYSHLLSSVSVLFLDNFDFIDWKPWFHEKFLLPILEARLDQGLLTFFISKKSLSVLFEDDNFADLKEVKYFKKIVSELVIKRISI